MKKEIIKPKKVCLALQGGGAHGSFTWGVLDKLLEDGRIEVEGLSGTSAGAMNALAMVQGLMNGGLESARKSLSDFWRQLSTVSAKTSPYKMSFYDKIMKNYNCDYSLAFYMCNILSHMLSPYQLNPFNINALKDLVESFFDFEKLRNYDKVKVFLCATHVASGKLKNFTLKSMTADKMLASACLPELFQAVKVDNDYYWDGGFIGDPAIYPLIYNCESPDIIIIRIKKIHHHELPTTVQQINDRLNEITFNACLMREMRNIYYITKLIDEGTIDPKKVKKLHIHVIDNENLFAHLGTQSIRNTDWDFLQHMFQAGRKTAAVWLDEYFDCIGVKTSAQIYEDYADEE